MQLLEILAVILLADAVTGVVHWWEDVYARADSRWFGALAAENLRHHVKPRAFLANGYWKSSWDLWLLGAGAVAVFAACDALTWHVILFAALVANANQVHKWAHRTGAENGRLIGGLQRLHVLQSARHHSKHHQGERNTHYCVLTNFLNPLLEEVDAWRRLERAAAKLFGVKRRDEALELAKLGLIEARRRPAAAGTGFAIRLLQPRPRCVGQL